MGRAFSSEMRGGSTLGVIRVCDSGVRQKERRVCRGRGNRTRRDSEPGSKQAGVGISANAGREGLEPSRGGHRDGPAVAATVNFCTAFLGDSHIPG